MTAAPITPSSEVMAILDELDRRGVRFVVVGGWGVDALVGEQTRLHRDLDLLVAADRCDEVVGWLADRG